MAQPRKPRRSSAKPAKRGGSGRAGASGRAGNRSQARRRADGKQGTGKAGRDAGKQPTGKDRAAGATRSGKAAGAHGRGRSDAAKTESKAGRRRDLKGAAVNLPNWTIEALVRVTPKDRVAGALEALGEATTAFEDGQYHRALKQARRAKQLSPRDVTTREILGLSAYRVGDWAEALKELRTYRRLSGDTVHLPIEMDALRALGRFADVETTWTRIASTELKPAAADEAKVVYGSHLIDQGRPDEALEVTRPKRLRLNRPSEMRVWYVAARAAARAGDADLARSLRNAILEHDPAFPGIDELEREIASAAT